MRPVCAVAAAAILVAAPGVRAADAPPNSPMKMDEPMHGEMKRPTMKKGDVKKAAERKKRAAKPAPSEPAGAAKQ